MIVLNARPILYPRNINMYFVRLETYFKFQSNRLTLYWGMSWLLRYCQQQQKELLCILFHKTMISKNNFLVSEKLSQEPTFKKYVYLDPKFYKKSPHLFLKSCSVFLVYLSSILFLVFYSFRIFLWNSLFLQTSTCTSKDKIFLQNSFK